MIMDARPDQIAVAEDLSVVAEVGPDALKPVATARLTTDCERHIHAISLLTLDEVEPLRGHAVEVWVQGDRDKSEWLRIAKVVTGGAGVAVLAPPLLMGAGCVAEVRAKVTEMLDDEEVQFVLHGTAVRFLKDLKERRT